MEHTRFLILGAGPTGLGAAYRLQELRETDFLILEQEELPGGLAASFTDDAGFTWDIGGHIQFSHYRYFDELMRAALPDDQWIEHQRESWVWIAGRFVPYPVQNHLRHLPRDLMWKCLDGFLAASLRRDGGPPANFKDWMLARFGTGLAETFLFPYNFKVWAYPPEQLSYQWVGERVAVPDVRRAVENVILEQDDIPWGPNRFFRFPSEGGTGSVWKRVAALLGEDRVRYQATVERIDTGRKVVTCRDGSAVGYEILISTVPVDRCAELIAPIREDLRKACGRLKYSASNIVGLGLKGGSPCTLRVKNWIYFPETNCPFYRATVFSNYSPKNVPDASRYWSLLTETSESIYRSVRQEALVEETIQGCLNTGLIRSADDVVSVWRYRAAHGYPTPSLERDSVLNEVLPRLEEIDIYSRGRFGAWKYEAGNQDHSVMQGVELVNRLLLQIPETTLNFPEIANSGTGKG